MKPKVRVVPIAQLILDEKNANSSEILSKNTVLVVRPLWTARIV
jgi:hypothetical protein